MEASDGKYYQTDCANAEGIFRIVQSIPSKKAEPFKKWLAKVAYERIQEIQDPKIAVISEGTFGLKTKAHKEIKELGKSHNLRDHMTPMELALTMLGETTTAEIARNEDAQGFMENRQAAKTGGEVAGTARKDIEKRIGRKVVSRQNFLPKKEEQKKLL